MFDMAIASDELQMQVSFDGQLADGGLVEAHMWSRRQQSCVSPSNEECIAYRSSRLCRVMASQTDDVTIR